MTTDSTRPLPFQTPAELELLETILSAGHPCYPWNPTDPNTDAYFVELEQEFETGWMAEEIGVQGQKLAACLDQLWTTIAPVARDHRFQALLEELVQRFSAQIPRSFLEGIMQRAQQALVTQTTLADQLVMCVQDLLPGWGEDDLYVLARPLAHAMRGADTLESLLTAAQPATWSDLSSVDQAKLSLAIARYTLSQLPANAADHS